MADPARIKPAEVPPERSSSASEEHPNSEDTEDVPATSKPTDESKDSSSEDQHKQEAKSVSGFGVYLLKQQGRLRLKNHTKVCMFYLFNCCG